MENQKNNPSQTESVAITARTRRGYVCLRLQGPVGLLKSLTDKVVQVVETIVVLRAETKRRLVDFIGASLRQMGARARALRRTHVREHIRLDLAELAVQEGGTLEAILNGTSTLRQQAQRLASEMARALLSDVILVVREAQAELRLGYDQHGVALRKLLSAALELGLDGFLATTQPHVTFRRYRAERSTPQPRPSTPTPKTLVTYEERQGELVLAGA